MMEHKIHFSYILPMDFYMKKDLSDLDHQEPGLEHL